MKVTKSIKILVLIIAVVVIVLSVWYASSQLFPNSGSNLTLPTGSPSPTPPKTIVPTATPTTSTPTPRPTSTATQTPGQTQTPAPTLNPTPTGTPIPTASPTPSPTPTPTTPPGTVATFNFDNGAPTLTLRQATPFTQTSVGVTAQFTSPNVPSSAFSIQNAGTTFFTLSQFSGNYLEVNNGLRNRLDINFSQPIKSITITFATIDYHDPGTGGTATPIQMTAYANSAKTITVGTPVTAVGVFTTDTYPQGTLTINSPGASFTAIEILIPFLNQGATDFMVDNIIVTTA